MSPAAGPRLPPAELAAGPAPARRGPLAGLAGAASVSPAAPRGGARDRRDLAGRALHATTGLADRGGARLGGPAASGARPSNPL